MDKASIIRTIVLVIALINNTLAMKGMSPLPIADAEVEVLVSTIFTIVASTVAWWKDTKFKKKDN